MLATKSACGAAWEASALAAEIACSASSFKVKSQCSPAVVMPTPVI